MSPSSTNKQHFNDEKDAARISTHTVSTDELQPADQTKKQSLLGYLWDTADLPQEERRLLFKLDTSLLVFASLGESVKHERRC